jgi:hypothetical protein
LYLENAHASFVWLGRLLGALVIAGAIALTIELTSRVRGNEFWFIIILLGPGLTLGLLIIATAERQVADKAPAWAVSAGVVMMASSLLLAGKAAEQPQILSVSLDAGTSGVWAAINALAWTMPVPLAALLLLTGLGAGGALGSPSRWAFALGCVVVLLGVALGLKWALDPPVFPPILADRRPFNDVFWFFQYASVPAALGFLLAVAARPGVASDEPRWRTLWPALAGVLVLLAGLYRGIEVASSVDAEKIYAFLYEATLLVALGLLVLMTARLLPPLVGAGGVAAIVVVNLVLTEQTLTAPAGEIGTFWRFLIVMLQPWAFTALCAVALISHLMQDRVQPEFDLVDLGGGRP